VVSTAVNIPAVSAEDMEVLGPFIPLAERLGRIAAALTSGVERVEIEHMGRIAERDTRLLTLAVLTGLFAGRTEEDVNLVNAPALAEERGIEVAETREAQARDYADLLRVTVKTSDESVKVVGTTLGVKHRPHLLEAWGQRFNLQIDDPTVVLFRYQDVPGMVGRVGSAFGEDGINISAAAVGRPSAGEDGGGPDLAVMAVTTDAPVPPAVVERIAASDGFVAGRAVALGE
jgi:D-3-phosphoglycerate dehydrogenase